MTSERSIAAVLFDVGDILLPLNWRNLQTRLQISDEDFRAMSEDLSSSKMFYDFETGLADSAVFLASINDRLEMSHDVAVLAEMWNSFVGDVYPEMDELIRRLKKTTKVFALSNINPLHYEHILHRNPIFRDFDNFFASHLMASRKPDAQIYEKVIQSVGCRPGQILFFDDLKANVEAARSQGIHAYLIARPLEEIPPVLKEWGLLE